jgi:hypothetical protein
MDQACSSWNCWVAGTFCGPKDFWWAETLGLFVTRDILRLGLFVYRDILWLETFCSWFFFGGRTFLVAETFRGCDFGCHGWDHGDWGCW